MADFNYDKKMEHERLAASAMDSGEFSLALFHVMEAFKHTRALASRCGGVLGRAYLANAERLLNVAETLKAKVDAASVKSGEPSPNVAATPAGGVPGEGDGRKRWTIEKNTGIRLSDVKGLVEAKAAVEDAFVNSVRHSDIYDRLKIKFPSGMLLYGPPGTGKTMFARAIANEMDTVFMHVKMSDLKSKYVGETEKNIAEMFQEAHSYQRCILFIDECESLLRTRGNQKVNAVESFLVEMDGIKNSFDDGNKLFLLFATNRPWMLDSAITRPGRIGNLVYVGLPDAEAREFIIRSALKDLPLAADVDIGELVKRTEGYSGAELSHREHGGGVCDEASLRAARRWIARRKAEGVSVDSEEWKSVESVTWADFEEALRHVVPTSRRDADIIRRNEEYGRTGGAASGGGPSEDDD